MASLRTLRRHRTAAMQRFRQWFSAPDIEQHRSNLEALLIQVKHQKLPEDVDLLVDALTLVYRDEEFLRLTRKYWRYE